MNHMIKIPIFLLSLTLTARSEKFPENKTKKFIFFKKRSYYSIKIIRKDLKEERRKKEREERKKERNLFKILKKKMAFFYGGFLVMKRECSNW